MLIYAPHTPVAKARRARAGRVLGVTMLLLGAAVAAPQALASSDAGESAHVDTYTVAAGETLWEIAAGLTPAGADVRDTLARIQDLNARTEAGLEAGEQIVVPVVG